MEERQLVPLINAAVLAGDAHQMLTQQQQLQLLQNNHENGNSGLQPAAPPLQLQDAVQAMNPAATVNNSNEPLDHPTLPQMALQPAAAEPNTHSNNNTHIIDNSNLNLNHPQNETYKLQTNQYLLESSSRLDDAASELAQYTALLSTLYQETTSSHSKKSNHHGKLEAQECLTNITQSILPLLKVCSNAMKDAGKYFAPFSGTVNIHNRNDAELKRRLVQQEEVRLQQQQESGGRRRKRPALLMIEEFVERSNLIVSMEVDEDGGENDVVGGIATVTTAAAATVNTANNNNGGQSHSQPTTAKRKITKHKNKTTESILILQPRNGTVYTKSEALAIAKRYRKGSRERGLAIRAMIQQKFVLSSRKTLYRLLQMDEEGREVLENGWLGCGRPVKSGVEGGGVMRRDRVVDSTLRFEDLDVGSNRILVELGTKTKDDDGQDDDRGDVVEEGDTSKEQSQSNKQQWRDRHKKSIRPHVDEVTRVWSSWGEKLQES